MEENITAWHQDNLNKKKNNSLEAKYAKVCRSAAIENSII